jgi:hypothetical protein
MNKDSQRVTRRDVLATTSALAVASLAGCVALGDYTNEDIKTGARLWLPLDHPSLEEYDTKTIDGRIATVSYRTNIILYSDTTLEETLTERTDENFTKSPTRILGTIYIQTDGFGSSLADRATSQLRDRLDTAIRQEMESYGVENISRESTEEPEYKYVATIPVQHLINNDGLDDTQLDSLGEVRMHCGLEITPEQNSNNFRGFLWIQPTGTYEVLRVRTSDGSGDVLDVIVSRGGDRMAQGDADSDGDGFGDPDSDGDSLGDVTMEDEFGISLSTMKISTNSQKAIRR